MDGVINQQSPKKSRRFVLIILVFIIFAIGVFGGKHFLNSKNPKKVSPSVTITPTPTEYQFPTDTPSPSESPTPEKPPTSTPKPTTNPVDKATGLDRSKLSIEVQNGSGEVGAASKASDTLKTFGYKVIATGNADNFNYENTTIKVKTEKSDFLSLLKKDLGFSYTVGTASADLSASSSADALVIVGK